MAWTTSACLRALPLLQRSAAAQTKAAKLLVESWRSAASRCDPSLAAALPLAVLGSVTPLLPSSLTSIFLLGAGASLALLGMRSPQRPIPLLRQAASAPSGQRAPSTFQSSEIALGEHPKRAGVAASRRRLAPEPDGSWAELMARINHDLRTPLNAVVGFSELMVLELFGPLGDERYQDYAHHIRDSATELLKSAEDTLALTALVANPNRRDATSACDLELLAADAWAFISRKAAGRAIDFAPFVAPGLEVVGEPRVLRQILVNILSEAVARAAHGERVVLSAVTEGELIELSVSASKERTSSVRRDSSLAICLARTLLELQGTSLLEIDSTGHGWRAVTVLDRAVQPDFFTERFGAPAPFAMRESMPAFVS